MVGSSGKLPDYTPPVSGAFKKSGNKTYGMSPEDKMSFIKKELCSSIAADWAKEDASLGLLVEQMITEHSNDENFLAIYFDLLKATVK